MSTETSCGVCSISAWRGAFDSERCKIHDGLYIVGAHRRDDLDKLMAKWNRKGAKLGSKPIGYQVVSEHQVPVWVKQKTFSGHKWVKAEGVTRKFLVVKLVGSTPRVEGYEFIARLEHTAAGNIISKAPSVRDVDVDKRFRTAEPFCVHCSTVRRRNDTFLIREVATGVIIQVGRNCLADFIRSEDVAGALHMWKFIDTLAKFEKNESEGGYGGGRGGLALATEHFVACAWRAYHLHGWAPSSFERSTKGEALHAAYPLYNPNGDAKLAAEWKQAQPLTEDKKLAAESLKWARTLEPGNSDYLHNLKVNASLPTVEARGAAGILASIVKAYSTHMDREVERKKKATRGPGNFFGKVGGKYVREVKITGLREIDGEWGLSRLYTFEDKDGHVFKWFATGGTQHPHIRQDEEGYTRHLRAGDEGWMSFSVKKHETFRDQKQTMVTRAGMLATPPPFGFKWLSPDGEVFKTKKAMVAAGFTPGEKPKTFKQGGLF